MKVLLTGSNGQLGNSIINTKSENIDLVTTRREELDLSNPKYCEDFILKNMHIYIILILTIHNNVLETFRK